MAAFSMRFMAVLALSALALLAAALVNGRGEDPYQAFQDYIPYTPGNPSPDDLMCGLVWEYPGWSGDACRLGATRYCRDGYVIVRDDIIIYTRLYNCDLPVAYLIAHYGRYNRIARLRRIAVLVWDKMSAQGDHLGQFNDMSTVDSVSWWSGVSSP